METAIATTAPAVVTLARGRTGEFDRLVSALNRSSRKPAELVVAWVAGPDPSETVRGLTGRVRVVKVDGDDHPLAQARNAVAEATLADKLIYLDARCVPCPALVGEFEHALERAPNAIVQGPVCPLPEDFDDWTGSPAAVPEASSLDLSGDEAQFTALNFAVRRHTVLKTLSGFDGTDSQPSDFTNRAREAGVEIAWDRRAVAFHPYAE